MAKSPAWWLWVAALVPTLAVGALRWSAGPGIGAEDYAQYILHARALVDGRPYRDTGYLVTELNRGHGPAAFPPGVPLVLAALFKVAGENAAAIRITMFALSLGFFLLAGRYFALTGDPWGGLGVTLLVGLSSGVVRFSNQVQSDLPFCFAVWAMLCLADRPETWTWRRSVAIALLGLVAMSTRALGVMLVPAALLFAAWRWRELRWKGLFPALTWMAVIGAGAAIAGLPFLARRPAWLAPGSLLEALRDHQEMYRVAGGYALTDPFPGILANYVYHLVAIPFVGLGLVLWVRQTFRSLLVWFAIVYGGILMILPFGEYRYMWVLFPVVIYGLMRGVAAVARRVLPAVQPQAAALALGTAVATGAVAIIVTSGKPGEFATRPAVQDLFSALRRLNAEAPMRVAFSRPRILALETGIPSMPLVFRRQTDVIEAELQHQCITHVVIGSLGLRQAHDHATRVMVAQAPEHFERVYRNRSFTVYRFVALRSDNCPPTIPGAAARKLPL